MRLYQQLVLFMLAATVLPLAVLGFWLISVEQQELAARIDAQQRAVAEAAAESASADLLGAVDALARSAESFDWLHASDDEITGGLRLLYRQSPLVSAVVLLGADGSLRAGPVYLPTATEDHPGFDERGLEPLVEAVPVAVLQRGAKGQTGMSEAYLHALRHMSAVALAIRLSSEDRSPFAVAELGLGVLSDKLALRAGDVGRIAIVDSTGRTLASSDGTSSLAPIDPALWKGALPALGDHRSASFRAVSGEMQRAAVAKLPGDLGLYTVVSLPERVALSPVRAMRKTVLLSIGAALLVLLALGALFTRRLNRRLFQVVAGAEAFTRGELKTRIPVTGSDELTDLSETFNRMGGELEGARVRLERWNDDLRQKVQEATAELRAAQVQLLETQKLAAVGQLGAGVAHEINNPLAGILGNTQLLLLDRDDKDPDFDTLRKIEQSAKRCKEITQNLLRFSQQRERAELRQVDLNAVVRDAFSLTTSQAKGEGIALVAKLQPGALMVKGDPGHLSQVVLALLSNARTAMLKAPTKELKVTTREEGESVVVEVKDTGKGIAPEHLPRIFEPFFTTKDVWSNVGLGLSVAYRVMSEHQGKIDVQTEVGKGSTFTVRLPKARPQSASITASA